MKGMCMPPKPDVKQPKEPVVQKEKAEKKTFNRPFLYIFSVIILVIIVVTFVGTPVVGKMAGPGRIIFGYYKGRPIEYSPGNYFSQQRDLIAEQIRSGGEKDSNIEAQIYQVWQGAFIRTIYHLAAVTAMEESGAHVSENRIDEALTRHPAYMENGEFSERRYRQTASAERFVTRRATRDRLLYETYLHDLFGVRSSRDEVDFFKSLAAPERKVRFVNFSFSEFPDSAVAAFGGENPEKFKRMKLSGITITTGRNDAAKVREQAAGRTAGFEDLAKTHSKDAFAEKGGDMGWRYFYELDDFAKNLDDIRGVFALKPGEISPVIEGPEGYRIFRCDEAALEPDMRSPEVLGTVRSYMSAFERGKIEDYILTQAREFKAAAEAGSFSAAAGARGKTAAETDYFPINYGNSVFLKPVSRANDALGGAAFRDTFFSTVFSLPAGAVSDPVILRDNVVVLQLAGEKEPEPNEVAFLDAYFPFIIQQFEEEDLRFFIMNTKDLKDNFNAVFAQLYTPREG